MPSGEFAARATLQILFKRARFRLRGECNRRFDSPGFVFCRMRTVASVVFSQASRQVARDARVMLFRISFADEDVNVKKSLHLLARQAVVFERPRTSNPHGPPSSYSGVADLPFCAGAPGEGLEPRGSVPLLSFAADLAQKSAQEELSSPGSNPLLTHFVIVAKSRPVLLPPKALLQAVNFYEGIARGVVHSAHNRGVAPRRQSGDDGCDRTHLFKPVGELV
jgi:hypothetical protein